MPKKRSPTRWTEEEDELLKKAVKKSLEKSESLKIFENTFELPKNFSWVEISNDLGNTRNSKQCRERFHNHLKPGINHLPWTEIEDDVLLLLGDKYPSQWTVIARYLKGRTENMVKLRWRYHQRKKEKIVKNNKSLIKHNTA